VPLHTRCLCFCAFVALLPGCVNPQIYTPQVPACRAKAVVFVVDGAGGFHSTAIVLHRMIEKDNLPLCMRAVNWNHVFGRALADHANQEHQARSGYLLAQEILACRQENPAACITLLSHSAGSGVLLQTVKYLPPDSLDHVIILAPAVSACADLRAALACARGGVDVFNSDRDWFFLGIATGLFGTSDGKRGAAAGLHGFTPTIECPEDAPLFARLRQHQWDPSVAWTGHKGSHAGSHFPLFLKYYVLPIIMSPA
jgi:hypothetical protein